MAKEIPLTKGFVAIVDDEDYEWLSQWKWYKSAVGYPRRTINKTNKKEYLHQSIMKTPPGLETDHIDHDKLNNQRHNLRVASKSQNNQNRKKRNGTSSKYKGLYRDNRRNRWVCKIKLNNKNIQLGYFENEIEAALMYDVAAKYFFKEFALLNFPDNDDLRPFNPKIYRS